MYFWIFTKVTDVLAIIDITFLARSRLLRVIALVQGLIVVWPNNWLRPELVGDLRVPCANMIPVHPAATVQLQHSSWAGIEVANTKWMHVSGPTIHHWTNSIMGLN